MFYYDSTVQLVIVDIKKPHHKNGEV